MPARLIDAVEEPKRKRVLIGRYKLAGVDAKPSDVPMSRLKVR